MRSIHTFCLPSMPLYSSWQASFPTAVLPLGMPSCQFLKKYWVDAGVCLGKYRFIWLNIRAIVNIVEKKISVATFFAIAKEILMRMVDGHQGINFVPSILHY